MQFSESKKNAPQSSKRQRCSNKSNNALIGGYNCMWSVAVAERGEPPRRDVNNHNLYMHHKCTDVLGTDVRTVDAANAKILLLLLH